MLNPPIAWVLTAAEIWFGNLVASWGYPVMGGFIMGLAAGTFLGRATAPYHILRHLSKLEGGLGKPHSTAAGSETTVESS